MLKALDYLSSKFLMILYDISHSLVFDAKLGVVAIPPNP